MISNLTCQHCGKAFEAEIVDKTEFCPHCGRETAVQAVPASAAPRSAGERLGGTVTGLREQAGSIVGMAVAAVVVAVLVLIVTFCLTLDVTDEAASRYWGNGLSLAGSLCSLAVALYVIAQIVHIRANTLK